MIFASIFETFKNKKNKALKTKSKEDDKNLSEWTFSNKVSKKTISKDQVMIEEKNKDYNKKEFVIESDKKNTERKKIDEKDRIKNLKENTKKEKRLKENLKYLHATVDTELVNPSLETLNDESEFLKIKKYELKKIKKENVDLIQDDEEIKKSIKNFQKKLIKRIEKYNYFVGVFLEKTKSDISKEDKDLNNDTCGSDEFGGESIKDNVVTKNYAELAEALIEHNNSKKTKKSDIIKTEILSIGKHSNVGEAIVKYLLNNTSKFISGPMGWNSEVFESVEDWAVMRSLGIMEEFRAKYPDRNLVNECQGMQIVLDITNEEDLKIISIEKIDVKNTKEKVFEFLNVDDYKKYFVKILSGIFDKELNDAKEMQVIDIENSNTNDILSEDQIVKFREVKYMIGEVIGESSNSKEEVLKSYMDRVVEEMFNKCKKDGSCNDIENSVFNKIFEL